MKEFPMVEERGEDEHSDLMQEERPFDLKANETGAHFTHPATQNRGLIPTSLDTMGVGEKPTATSIFEAEAKLPAALITLISKLPDHSALNCFFQMESAVYVRARARLSLSLVPSQNRKQRQMALRSGLKSKNLSLSLSRSLFALSLVSFST
jgi:hypothetical protein